MLSLIWGRLWACLYFYLRPMFKWILNRVTGKCELLRISYQYPQGAERTLCIEHSLRRSNKADIKRLAKDEETNIEAAVLLVMKTKYIIPEIHTDFEGIFRECLTQINGYCRLMVEVEDLRKTKYSTDLAEHEKKLMQLWTILTAGQVLTSRQSDDWMQIGFQGRDPQTDFRGMGILGLDQLIYFTTRYTGVARSLLSHSHRPQNGYSFAIVGINMTDLVYNLLRHGNLKVHFYNQKRTRVTLEDFNEVYCFAFHEFDKYWFSEKPKDIMEFGRVRERFRKKMVNRLRNYSTTLVTDFQAD